MACERCHGETVSVIEFPKARVVVCVYPGKGKRLRMGVRSRSSSAGRRRRAAAIPA